VNDLLAKMESSRRAARAQLAANGRLRADADERPLAPPRALLTMLATALADGGEHARAVERHYLELMPQMRVAQLDCNDGPEAIFFGAPLSWERLPRLSGALDRLFALLPAGTSLAGATSAAELRARRGTVGTLYCETCYGGFMPLLYGYPADLGYFARALLDSSIDTVIDRYLTAPLVHELTHFGRSRDVLSLYLDECVAAWLGVTVLPEFAFPAPGEDNGLFATPWFAQVGQALARVAGAEQIVAAQAGVRSWSEVLPPRLADTLTRLGRADYEATRPLHFLSDTFSPDRWMKLCFLAAADAPVVDDIALAELTAMPWQKVPAGDEDERDREILRDALRAMCLRNFQVERSFRVATRAPSGPITIDLAACRVWTAPGADGFDGAAPAYLFPPATAKRLRDAGIDGYRLELSATDEPDALFCAVVAAIVDGAARAHGVGWRLARL
jgi:hypothetical protein